MHVYFFASMFLSTAGTRRTQGPQRVIEEARPYADENITEVSSLEGELLSSPLIDFSTVLSATNNFSDRLGASGFGPVYKVGSFELILF
jgi:hypothetical protein